MLRDTTGRIFSYSEVTQLIIEYQQKLETILPDDGKKVFAVISERHIQLPVFLYTIIISGAAYLPVDYRFPAQRIIDIITDARPDAVIVQTKLLPAIQQLLASVSDTVTEVSADFSIITLKYPTGRFAPDVAYILYTSGSTGTPKGVIHTYNSVLSFLNWCAEAIDCKGQANFISITPLQFDLSVFDMFFPLFRQGSILVLSELELSNHRQLSQIISQYNIGCIYATPSFFQLLIDARKLQQYDYSHTNTILLAGEQLHWALLHDLSIYFKNACFYNLYGPTETNVCSYYKVSFTDEKLSPGVVPIGNMCSNATAILQPYDDDMFQLLVSSGTLMSGYVNDTATNPFHFFNNVAYYDTGDVVKKIFNDNFVYCGRADRMVKKNGFRIEPAEIENCLKTLDGVAHAIVLPVKKDGAVKIVAFIQSATNFTLLDIKKYCLVHLPYYMVPDDIMILENLPVNFNFKTDTQQLIDKYVV